ncbi:MAG: F0F1 ATP synthase subunit A [Lachnospiraceae bacterium]|nr:F0F1 ATP synthase subunit A [Lachnospiraceae bacterium]
MGVGMLLSLDDFSADSFMVKGVFSFEIGGQTLWITTTHICLILVVLTLSIFSMFAKRSMLKAAEVPTGFQNFVEMGVDLLDGLVKSTMGKHAGAFRNYIGTIFIFILFSNLSGLLGLRPPTADYGVTFPLGVLTFTLITFNKFKYQHVSGVIKGLMSPWPFWIPINLIGDFAVPISLSLRLFANVLSGTVMMSLVYGLLSMIAYAWPGALHVYFDMFSGAIQTYVFCMLTMTYITDARTTDEG